MATHSSNIEIKAHAKKSFSIYEAILSNEGAYRECILNQMDVFYGCREGRLKLRKESINIYPQPDTCQIRQERKVTLIYYIRPNVGGIKRSDYYITNINVNDEGSLHTSLYHANGILGAVKKTRTLYIFGYMRIHLDVVENLGTFIELEYVISDGQTAEDGYKVVEKWMKLLDIDKTDLIDNAYVDLIHPTLFVQQ